MTKPRDRKPAAAEVDRRMRALEKTGLRASDDRGDLEEFTAIERFITSFKQDPGMQGRLQRVSDRTLIENALNLANMSDLHDLRNLKDFVEVWQTIGSRGATATYSLDAITLPDIIRTFTDEQTGKIWRELFEEDFKEYQKAQKELDSMLELTLKDLPAARKKLGPILEERLKDLVIVTLPTFRNGRLLLEPRPYAPTIQTACAYALALLLDPTRPEGDARSFGERLRRCAYGMDELVDEPCGRWFLSFSTNRGPMPKYCCEEHRLKAANDTAAARAKGYRERKKKATRKSK